MKADLAKGALLYIVIENELKLFKKWLGVFQQDLCPRTWILLVDAISFKPLAGFFFVCRYILKYYRIMLRKYTDLFLEMKVILVLINVSCTVSFSIKPVRSAIFPKFGNITFRPIMLHYFHDMHMLSFCLHICVFIDIRSTNGDRYDWYGKL